MQSEQNKLIPLNLARNYAPISARTGRPLHPSVLHRWVKHGLLAADGSRVRLTAVKAGGMVCTSIAALDEFFAILTAKAGLAVPRTADDATTSAELVAAGLKPAPQSQTRRQPQVRRKEAGADESGPAGLEARE